MTSDNPQATSPPQQLRRRLPTLKTWLIILVGLVLLAYGANWLHFRFTHLQLDDARVDGEVITIASRVSGWVTALPAVEGDEVKKGQVLVAVDDRDSRAQRDVLRSRLASIDQQMGVVRAQSGQVDEETLGKLQAETNRLAAAQANVAGLDIQVKQAADDYKRSADLAQQKWLSPQALERTRLAYEQVQENQRKAVAEVAAARGTLSSAGGSRKQLQVMVQQLQVLARQADELRAEIRRQELDIGDRSILSPADGKVVMTFVRNGEHVTAGQRILMFHDPSRIWVEANVKETEVARLKVGMPVQVHVDAYRDQVFEGSIYRIGQAATSKFALLPDPNPSGNFTKITQRLPIRILLKDKDTLLRPGMMVEVSIDVRNR